MWTIRQFGRMDLPRPIRSAVFTKPFILISIADLGDNWEQHFIPESPLLVESLELSFHEHDPEMRKHWQRDEGDERGRHMLHTHRCFSARDAVKILDLLTRRLPEVDEVVVVCEAGFYRSLIFAHAIATLTDSPFVEHDPFWDDDRSSWLGRRLLWHAKRKRWTVPTRQ